MSLKPSKNIHKSLISTTSRLVGEFETNGVLLTHAWPDFYGYPVSMRLSEGPTSRSAYVFAFQTEDDPVKTGLIPDYSQMGDLICAYMAVLFGKRFDHHGLIEGSGFFHVPDMMEFGHLCRHSLPHNSHKSRPDFAVPLNLAEMKRIETLIVGESINQKFLRSFQTCSKFYMQALQNAERNPEVAYLHLITAGEILSNFYEYDKADLLDEDSKLALETIKREVRDGEKVARFISSKLLQIKKRFLKTLSTLIDETFFSCSESSNPLFGFKRNNFMKNISAAYDLRSRYVHTGIPFGSWISLTMGGDNNEIQIGEPVVKEDKELGKLIGCAPTFIGLERIIRYALLKCAEVHGAYLAQPMVQSNTLASGKGEGAG